MQTQILKHKKICVPQLYYLNVTQTTNTTRLLLQKLKLGPQIHAKAEAVGGRKVWIQMCLPVFYTCNLL